MYKRQPWKQWQLAKLTTMLSYAQRHCAYYKKHIIGEVRIDNSMEIIKSLPLLDKNIVRQQEKYIYSDEITDNWNIWLNTGGSTGEPLHFPALYRGLHVEGVCQMMLYMKMGYQWKDVIVSFNGCRICLLYTSYKSLLITPVRYMKYIKQISANSYGLYLYSDPINYVIIYFISVYSLSDLFVFNSFTIFIYIIRFLMSIAGAWVIINIIRRCKGFK